MGANLHLLGPAEVDNIGEKYFDKFCVFGNDMELNKGQQNFLDEFCEEHGKGCMKYYVHKMTHSCVVSGKCKMVIMCETPTSNFDISYIFESCCNPKTISFVPDHCSKIQY